MERKFIEMESRMNNRERDIQAAIDECKAAAHLERMRLIDLHSHVKLII